ncbi:MAG: transcriptional repressor [Chloroflexi bacterium]|nr:transcriptional repressor [Chloroflexota bacterium]MBI3931394.1 transcriptional repressor [Chloroflexota bacterium]
MESISDNEMGTETKTTDKNRRILNVPGLRITHQRASILEIIRQGKGHLDADEVYRRARERQPRLSLSTVYRTMQTLKKLGLIEEVHFDEEHHHYEMKPSTEHHHLVCLGCGRVVEFNYPLARLIKRHVTEAKGFEITGSEVRMTGYCPTCRQERK